MLLLMVSLLGVVAFAEGEQAAEDGDNPSEPVETGDTSVLVVDEALMYELHLLQGVIMSCTGAIMGYLSLGEVLRSIW